MVKTSLKDTYLGGTNPTALKNEGIYMPPNVIQQRD